VASGAPATAIEFYHPAEVGNVPDLVHRVRGLRFFIRHVSDGVAAIAASVGLVASVDRRRLVDAFVSWVDRVTSQRAVSDCNRRDYIIFSAALLLENLLERNTIAVQPEAGAPAERSNEVARFWPEGYLAFAYCLTVLNLVLAQEGFPPCRVLASKTQLSAWWSFRENFLEAPSAAVPFFDLFVGDHPNWTFPTIATERFAIKEGAGEGER
jgi:hypothetical protein